MADEDDPNPSPREAGSLRSSAGSSRSPGQSVGNGEDRSGSSSAGDADSREAKRASSKASSPRGSRKNEKNVTEETTRSPKDSIKSKSDEFSRKSDTASRQSDPSQARSSQKVEQLTKDEKDAKKQPAQRSRTGLRTREQRLSQKRFREMIGKGELRNEELGKRRGDLRQRLDLLECSVPAVMVWNIWRMAQGGQVCGVQRALEKHFRGPASGEACWPSQRPSQHYDCRVREVEAARKQAQRRMDEARSLWTERTAMLEDKKTRLEEARRTQEERKLRIQELNKEVKKLRETLDALESGACEAGECGDMECKRRLLSRVSSAGSIKSSDVECLERLQDLAQTEFSMKRQIADLERREDAYMKTLQQADEFWSKVEGDTASTLSALQEQLESKIAANHQLAEKVCQLEDELERLRARMTTCRSELEKFISVEKIDALIGRDDDLADVSDKSVAARVKMKHRPAGRDDDLADISDKEILADLKPEAVSKETLAKIMGEITDEELQAGIEQGIISQEILSRIREEVTPQDILAGIREGVVSKEILAKLKEGLTAEDILRGIKQGVISEDVLSRIKEGITMEEILAGLEQGTIDEEILARIKQEITGEEILSGLKEGIISEEILSRIKEEVLAGEILSGIEEGVISKETLSKRKGQITDEEILVRTEGLDDEEMLSKLKEGITDEEILASLEQGLISEEVLSRIKPGLTVEELVSGIKQGVISADILSRIKDELTVDDILSGMKQGVISEEILSRIKEQISDEEVLAALEQGIITEEVLSKIRERITDEELLAGLKQGVISEDVLSKIKRGVTDEKTLAVSEVSEAGTMARIPGTDQMIESRPQLTHASTDRPSDLVSVQHTLLGVKPEDLAQQEQFLKEAKDYLDRLGSLEKLYYDDDYGVCGPEYACYEDFPSETGLSAPDISTERSGRISERDEEQLLRVTSMETGPTFDKDEGVVRQETGDFKDVKAEQGEEFVVEDEFNEQVETMEPVIAESEIPADRDLIGEDLAAERVSSPLSEQRSEKISGSDRKDLDEKELSYEGTPSTTKTSPIPVEDVKDTKTDKDVIMPRSELLAWLDIVNTARATITDSPDCNIIKEDIDELAERIAERTGVEIKAIPEGLSRPKIKEEAPAEGKVSDTADLRSEVESEGKIAPDVEAVVEAGKAVETSAADAASIPDTGGHEQEEEEREDGVTIATEVSEAVPVELTTTTVKEERPVPGAESALLDTGDQAELSDRAGKSRAEPTSATEADTSTPGEVVARETDDAAMDATQVEYSMEREVLPGEIPVTVLEDKMEEREEVTIKEEPAESIEGYKEIERKDMPLAEIETRGGFLEETAEGTEKVEETAEETEKVEKTAERTEKVEETAEETEKVEETAERTEKLQEELEGIEKVSSQREAIIKEKKSDKEVEPTVKMEKPETIEGYEEVEREDIQLAETETREVFLEETAEEIEKASLKREPEEPEETVLEEAVLEEKMSPEEVEEPAEVPLEEEPESEREVSWKEVEVSVKALSVRTEEVVEGTVTTTEDMLVVGEVLEERADVELLLRVEDGDEVVKEVEVELQVSVTREKETAEIGEEILIRKETESVRQAITVTEREFIDKEVTETTIKAPTERSLRVIDFETPPQEEEEETDILYEKKEPCICESDVRFSVEDTEEVKEIAVELQVTTTTEKETVEIQDEEMLIKEETITITEEISRTIIQASTEQSQMLIDSQAALKPYLIIADIEEEEKDTDMISEEKAPCVCKSADCSLEPGSKSASKPDIVPTAIKTETVEEVSQTISSIATQTVKSQISKRSLSSRLPAHATKSIEPESKVSEPQVQYRVLSKDQSTVTTISVASQTEKPKPREPERKHQPPIPRIFRSHRPTASPTSGTRPEDEPVSINYERPECNCCLCGQTATKPALDGRLASFGKPTAPSRIDQGPRLCSECKAKRRAKKPSGRTTRDQEVYACPRVEPRLLFRRRLEKKDQECMANIRKANGTPERRARERKPANGPEPAKGNVSSKKLGNGEERIVKDPPIDCVCYETVGSGVTGPIKKFNCSCGDSD